MKFTESAVDAILGTMKRKGLSPKEFIFELSIRENGAFGIGFSKDRVGFKHQYGDLVIMVGPNLDMSGITIDFGEIDGRQGIIFLTDKQEEQNVDSINR